jgi:PPOX class probable F420-dependent enzyme
MLAELGAARYLSLTTFRRSGEAVSTAMWVARDGDSLVISTHPGSGKVKRLRNSPRVEVRASGISGRVRADAQTFAGTAEIIDDPADVERLASLLSRKYGFQSWLIRTFERRRSAGASMRVILRITAA